MSPPTARAARPAREASPRTSGVDRRDPAVAPVVVPRRSRADIGRAGGTRLELLAVIGVDLLLAALIATNVAHIARPAIVDGRTSAPIVSGGGGEDRP